MTTARQAHATRSTSIDAVPGDQYARSVSTCAFCKIVKGELPSFMVTETELSYAFLPLPQLTDNHILVVPKEHAVKMHELHDKYLADALIVAKKIARAHKLENYNILQNNGRMAYQSVDHVHFHVIPKPTEDKGLVVKWPPQGSQEQQNADRAERFRRHNARGKTHGKWTIK